MVYVYNPKKEEKLKDELPDIVREGTEIYIEDNIGVSVLDKDMSRDEFLDYCRLKSLMKLPILYTSEGSVDNLVDSFAGGFT